MVILKPFCIFCLTVLLVSLKAVRHGATIRPYLKTGFTLFSDMPGHQAPHGGPVPSHIHVTAFKPDIFIFNENNQEVIFEFTCPPAVGRQHRTQPRFYVGKICPLSLPISCRDSLSLFRCAVASLYEVVSVCPSVRPYVPCYFRR